MKTKSAAIRKYKKMWSLKGAFIVYQYERGHWSYCSIDSPVGQDLQRCGMVSEEMGIKAKQWERVEK